MICLCKWGLWESEVCVCMCLCGWYVWECLQTHHSLAHITHKTHITQTNKQTNSRLHTYTSLIHTSYLHSHLTNIPYTQLTHTHMCAWCVCKRGVWKSKVCLYMCVWGMCVCVMGVQTHHTHIIHTTTNTHTSTHIHHLTNIPYTYICVCDLFV